MTSWKLLRARTKHGSELCYNYFLIIQSLFIYIFSYIAAVITNKYFAMINPLGTCTFWSKIISLVNFQKAILSPLLCRTKKGRSFYKWWLCKTLLKITTLVLKERWNKNTFSSKCFILLSKKNIVNFLFFYLNLGRMKRINTSSYVVKIA